MSGGGVGNGAWTGGRVSERARCVLAPNASPMTLEGTNTWVLAEPGSHHSVVVDPGPDDAGHLSAVLAAATEGGREVALILATHRHRDHVEGAASFAALADAPVRAVDPAFQIGHRQIGHPKAGLGAGALAEGERIDVDGLEVRVLATPGHTDDCVTFWLPQDRAILTGDMVLGRGPTVVAHPDGVLADYLDSLARLRALAGEEVGVVYPGHGPLLPDAATAIDYYLKHRQMRLEQVRSAVAAGDRTPRQVLERVYADVDRALWPAAEWSVRAQLVYLGVPITG
ncbi:MAG: MBL fold metallo-hydrolase [Sporichthyaceae bacterium]